MMSALSVDVSDLVGKPGATKEFSTSRPVAGLRLPLVWVEPDQSVEIDLVAHSVREGIEVLGRLSGTMRFSCSRCLVDFGQNFSHPVQEIFYYSSEDEEAYRVAGTAIDLEQMVRDVVVLSMPIRPLHRPDCKGLCPICGADRNLVDCGHSLEPVDERWAPLKDLFSESHKEA
jgi:uncharacterized protein